MGAYYNENNPTAAAWLRELIKEGLIADGEVDERSITDVQPDEVRGFDQCHFFAGIGGWSYALRLANWPDKRSVWTFSCPCQRLSNAARGRKVAKDMWPEQRRLIIASLPRVFFGEQVASSRYWFDGLCDDVEAVDYEVGAAVLPAVAVGANHARQRIYFVGDTYRYGESVSSVDAKAPGVPRNSGDSYGVGRKNGISTRMAALSGFGNAIVPQVAAEVIIAYLASNRY